MLATAPVSNQSREPDVTLTYNNSSSQNTLIYSIREPHDFPSIDRLNYYQRITRVLRSGLLPTLLNILRAAKHVQRFFGIRIRHQGRFPAFELGRHERESHSFRIPGGRGMMQG